MQERAFLEDLSVKSTGVLVGYESLGHISQWGRVTSTPVQAMDQIHLQWDGFCGIPDLSAFDSCQRRSHGFGFGIFIVAFRHRPSPGTQDRARFSAQT